MIRRLVRTLLLAAALLAAPAGGPAAGRDLSAPWPSPAELTHIRGEPLSFPSHSPFTLSDVGDPEDDPPTAGQATLFLPAEASARGPVPAAVLLHGASGVLGARELTYGRQLAALGVAALVVDAFTARRERATSFLGRLMEITEAMLLADAYAGLGALRERPEVDASRVALIGFSYGGMAALYAVYRQVAERFAPDGARFAGHVAFYAPCIARFEDNRTTGAPVLMLFGGRDATVDEARCAEVGRELEEGGSPARIVVYEDAVHQWDGIFRGPRMIGRSLSGCRFVVEADGTVRDGRTWLPMIGPLTRKAILALCADDEGYLIGRDDGVRARSNRDLGLFLGRVFERGASH